MTLFNKMLVFIYKKMKALYSIEEENRKKESCLCDTTTRFYDTATVLNASNQSSIQIGKNTYIRGDIRSLTERSQIKIGEECYLGENSHIWSFESIEIGDRVLIAHNCNIFDNDTHPKSSKKRNEHFKDIVTRGRQQNPNVSRKGVVIEDDVWIGANCTILKGCTIGKKSIIGVGTVVNRNIPENSVAYGNPLVIKSNEFEMQE